MAQEKLAKILLFTPYILQAAVLIAVLVRRMYRDLPYFFSYTTNIVVQSIVLFAVAPHKTAYFYVYWGGELISWMLGMAVIYEIYAALLKEYAVLHKFGTLLFRIMGIVLLLI